MPSGLTRLGSNLTDNVHPLPKLLIAIAVIVAIAWMFPHGESIQLTSTSRAVWTDRDLIAPFSFPVYKDAHEYQRERQEAIRGIYPVFERNESATAEQFRRLSVVMDALYEAAAARSRFIRGKLSADSVTFARAVARLPFTVSDGQWSLFQQWLLIDNRKEERPFARFESILGEFMAEVLRVGILNVPRNEHLRDSLAIRKGPVEQIVPATNFITLPEAVGRIDAQIASVYGGTEADVPAQNIVRAILSPNIIYNDEETKRLLRTAQDNVPLTIGFVQEKERIVSKHDRITDEIRLKLDSFQKAKAEREVGLSEWQHWTGILLHVSIVIALFAIYIYLFRKKVFYDNSKLILLGILILLVTFAAHLTLRLDLSQPVQYLIFVPAGSMLLAIIFDSRVAFYGTVTMALLIAGIRGADYTIALTSLTAGALGAYTVRDIHNRTQIFRSLVFIFVGYAVPIVALSLEQFESVETILMSLTFALANAVFSPVITYGLLIFFERAFRVTTDLTLLELSDFNHPLLRQLSEKAPGTFHHSMLLGTMAESAAESIGANPILARVGAYYHDIGKMLKPEYFVENQIGTTNKHNRLKPNMSALIIAAHVKEGVELGRQYKLPQTILDFIPQHHGTTWISFFYDKALRHAARRPDREVVHEEDYRYPGPKPQTKETGIVMLADSVEASTRALGEVTPQSLDSAIDQMIRQRFMEGQLDECDLTLRDLKNIREAFSKILTGIHHQRIKYPEQVVAEEKKAGMGDAPAQDVTLHEPPLGKVSGNGGSQHTEGPRT